MELAVFRPLIRAPVACSVRFASARTRGATPFSFAAASLWWRIAAE